MPGIDLDVMCHHIALDPGVKPVSQRKRKGGEEKRKVIVEEVDKLMKVRFIGEIKYLTWLSNVVMVKKKIEKWRMCTDFTNLNKACPKDPYLLPHIDRLIDGASRFRLLSFVDAYFGYNQIHMNLLDAS